MQDVSPAADNGLGAFLLWTEILQNLMQLVIRSCYRRLLDLIHATHYLQLVFYPLVGLLELGGHYDGVLNEKVAKGFAPTAFGHAKSVNLFNFTMTNDVTFGPL